MDQNLKTLLGQPIEEYTGETIKPGLICYTVVPYIHDTFTVVRPVSYDSASQDYSNLNITTTDNFKELCDNLPHTNLSLRSDEELLVSKIKKRPVVVLSHELARVDSRGFPPHYKKTVLCAPLFTLIDSYGAYRTSYNSSVIRNVTALKYSFVFPIPGQPYLNSKISGLRMDRIHSVHTNCLKISNKKITRRWLGFIREWVRFYGTGRLTGNAKHSGNNKIAEYLQEARELLLDAASQMND